jgi:hypothetical protein
VGGSSYVGYFLHSEVMGLLETTQNTCARNAAISTRLRAPSVKVPSPRRLRPPHLLGLHRSHPVLRRLSHCRIRLPASQ